MAEKFIVEDGLISHLENSECEFYWPQSNAKNKQAIEFWLLIFITTVQNYMHFLLIVG